MNFNGAVAQKYKKVSKSYFGLQIKPLIPLEIVGDKSFIIQDGNFRSKISPTLGYSYGGIVRVGLTELLALETGINYTKRNFRADYTVIDSNLTAKDNIGYISFDVPLNLLVFVKLGKETFMNVAGGMSMNYNPSNVRSPLTPDEFKKDVFIFEGKRYNYFDFNVNAEVGFEYRTPKSGMFYLGMSGRIPFSPTLEIAAEYRYDTFHSVARGIVEGATFAFNLKYFFHNVTHKKGVQKEKGPIEQ